MSDYIDRQEAIEAICKVCSIVGDYHKCNGYPETSTWCEEITALRAILSADVQLVRHGQWVGYFEPGCESYHCTACGTAWYPEELYLGGNDYPKYCPECGAKMENWKSEIDGEPDG